MAEQVHDLTENLPTLEPATRDKVKRGLAAVGIFAAALLLIDKLVKRFKNRKTVTVTVTENPWTEVPSSEV